MPWSRRLSLLRLWSYTAGRIELALARPSRHVCTFYPGQTICSSGSQIGWHPPTPSLCLSLRRAWVLNSSNGDIGDDCPASATDELRQLVFWQRCGGIVCQKRQFAFTVPHPPHPAPSSTHTQLPKTQPSHGASVICDSSSLYQVTQAIWLTRVAIVVMAHFEFPNYSGSRSCVSNEAVIILAYDSDVIRALLQMHVTMLSPAHNDPL